MEVERDRLKLRDDPKVISAPLLDPAWQCGIAVVVRGYIANATLDVELDGVIVVAGFPGGFPVPNGALVPLPAPLVAGQKLRVRQKSGGATSPWSASMTIGDHTTDFPAGPPRPQINPAPVYECGVRTGVGNLLVGSNVWITADGIEVGRKDGAASQQGVNVAPPYLFGQSVVAWSSLCNDPSPPSITQTAQSSPNPLPVPGFLPVYDDGQQLTITNVVNGARITLSRNGIVQFTFPSWGYQHTVGLTPPFATGETSPPRSNYVPAIPPAIAEPRRSCRAPLCRRLASNPSRRATRS